MPWKQVEAVARLRSVGAQPRRLLSRTVAGCSTSLSSDTGSALHLEESLFPASPVQAHAEPATVRGVVYGTLRKRRLFQGVRKVKVIFSITAKRDLPSSLR